MVNYTLLWHEEDHLCIMLAQCYDSVRNISAERNACPVFLSGDPEQHTLTVRPGTAQGCSH